MDLQSRLGLLLGKNWQKALQVLDKAEVQCYQAETSGRRVFKVPGTAGEEYVTMAKSYCSCQAHYYEVVTRSDAPYIRVYLRPDLAPKTVSLVKQLATRKPGACKACKFYRHEPCPQNFGKDNFYGPPYALLQGSLADLAEQPPFEGNPPVKKGKFSYEVT
eukprot:gene3683-3943_t